MSELELDYEEDDFDTIDTTEPKLKLTSMDTRRKIEELLERKRLREEFGEFSFD